EGRISTLKRSYGWNRSLMDGVGGAEVWCGYGILAHNSVKISGLIGDDHHPTSASTSPPSPPPPPRLDHPRGPRHRQGFGSPPESRIPLVRRAPPSPRKAKSRQGGRRERHCGTERRRTTRQLRSRR